MMGIPTNTFGEPPSCSFVRQVVQYVENWMTAVQTLTRMRRIINETVNISQWVKAAILK